MGSISRRSADVALRIFASGANLTPADQDLLARLTGEPQAFEAGSWIEPQTAPEERAWLVVSGWAAQARVLSDRRRQIGRLLLPGDVAGLSHLGGGARLGLLALTEVVVADFNLVRAAVEAGKSRGLARAWAELQRAEQAGALQQIMRLGRFTAFERTGDLLLELYERLVAAGLAHDRSMPMPLTQEVLADCLGLSIVHLNRMVQLLRRNQLIASEPRRISFLDLERLAEECHHPLSSEALAEAAPRSSFTGRAKVQNFAAGHISG
ncbi:Crp/Fnr family transcriptional regulator [Phenylobacterium sp. LjRoot219]|uniref:Crp/Fnr family transcriptional regulator n=1 Tax=Phenylobacterium sp. LjRoot219 TaxID=3342283 RepID=UPI003ED050E5